MIENAASVPTHGGVTMVPSVRTSRIPGTSEVTKKRSPEASTAMPLQGSDAGKIFALVAGPPSPVSPHAPVPATVWTNPPVVTLRITQAKGSATKNPPPGGARSALGYPNCALVAGPPSPVVPLVPVPAT